MLVQIIFLFAQKASDRSSLLVGKWKLTSHWYNDAERKRKFSKAEIGQIFYEFNADDKFKFMQINNKDTLSTFGDWSITDGNITRLVLYNNWYYYEGGKFDMVNVNLIMSLISKGKLNIKRASYYEEATHSTMNCYNSTFEKTL